MNHMPKQFKNSLAICLTMSDCAQEIEFLKEAFGATELKRMKTKDGKKIMHAELRIDDQTFIVADSMSDTMQSPKKLGGTSASMLIYVQDVDQAFARAIKAGAKKVMEPTDMFWGDRFSTVTDPEGHVWALATHIEDVTPKESRERIQAGAAG